MSDSPDKISGSTVLQTTRIGFTKGSIDVVAAMVFNAIDGHRDLEYIAMKTELELSLVEIIAARLIEQGAVSRAPQERGRYSSAPAPEPVGKVSKKKPGAQRDSREPGQRRGESNDSSDHQVEADQDSRTTVERLDVAAKVLGAMKPISDKKRTKAWKQIQADHAMRDFFSRKSDLPPVPDSKPKKQSYS